MILDNPVTVATDNPYVVITMAADGLYVQGRGLFSTREANKLFAEAVAAAVKKIAAETHAGLWGADAYRLAEAALADFEALQ